jgi:hypothetical protein
MYRAARSRRQKLSLSEPVFQTWCRVNGIAFHGVKVGASHIDGGGEGVLADRDLSGGEEGPLMVVPRDMILSRESVELQAKSDKWLREVLGACGEFGRVSYIQYSILSSSQLVVSTQHAYEERKAMLRDYQNRHS